MKKFYLAVCTILLLFPLLGYSQCSTTNATGCQCPPGGGTNCDLLPDISIARLPLTQSSNYTEYPQVCVPSCSGNDGRLRLGVSTPIIGFGPLETRGTSKYVCGTDTVDAGTVANIPAACPITGDPPHQLINQRIYHKNGSTMTFTDRAAGSMTYHPSHGHQHIDNWGIYTLRTSNGDPNPVNWPIIGSGTKLGFCLLDIGSCNGSSGYCTDSLGNTLNSSNIVNYGLGGGNYGCSNTVQGISNGYMDTYSQSLDGMWINLPPGLCNGTYYVVIQIDPYNYFQETNENNNVVAVPITLTQQGGTAPVITAGGPTSFCAGGSVTLTSTGATNYLWTNGATTQSITVNSSGSYSVTVNTGSSCSSTSQPVTVTATSLTVNASAGSTAICAGQSTQLSVTHNASGTTTVPTQFTNNTQVFIPDNNATGVTSPVTVSGINPTTLSSGMIVSVKINITHTYDSDLIISLISPSGNQINLSNQRGGSGDNFTNTIFSMSAATTIANGTAPFTGSYIPDGSFNSLTGNVNGLWRLKVADVAAVDTGRIRNWTLTINNVVAVPPAFSWTSNPAGFTSTTQNPTIAPATTTTYTVIVTSGNGCTGSSSVTVTVNPLPTVTANNVSGCTGTSIALSGTPAGGTWSVANPYSGPGTTYTHTYTDSNGCTNTSLSANITVNPLPTVTANNVSGCTGSSIALSGTPAGGTWSVANPYTGSSTTYTHTYTDANGCTNTSSAATITVNPLPTVTASNVSGCAGASIALSGTPAGGTWSVANPYTGSSTTYTHTYTDANGCTNTSSSANITVNPLPTVTANNVSGCTGSFIALSGTPAGGTWSVANPYSGPSTAYTHTYTDQNGCTNTSSAANITVNPLPTVTANNVSGCAGTSIALSGTPAGGTFSVPNPYSGSSTTYTYTYTDGNGCSNTSSAANITVNPLPTVTANNVSGCTGTSIALSGTPAGGTFSVPNPYSGSSTTYTYTYTDGNGCSNTSSAANITVNPLPTVTANNVSGCTGTSIALSGTPAGGTFSVPNPYSGSSTTYTYTYTDGNGCSNTSSAANITVNPLPTVTANNVSGCTGTSIALSGTPAGGTFSVPNPYSGSSTTYTYTYTYGNGCSNTSSAANITVNPLPTVTASNVSGCAGTSIALSGTPAGGTWSVANPYTGPSTTYTHTYTDGNGCTNTSAAANITVNPLPTVTANNVSGCTGTSIAVSGTPAGGTFSVPNPYSGSSTTYTYTYTDGNGCTNTSSAANITVNPLPTVSFSGLAASYSISASAVTLTGSPVGGTFSGPGISGNTFTPSAAGAGGPYTITYSYADGNGCSNSSSQQTTVTNCTVTAMPGVINSIGGAAKMCPGDAKSYYVTAVSGATSYTWTPPAGGVIISGQGTAQVAISYTAAYTVTGTLSVVANNACGSSAARTLTITRNNPITPGVIAGLAYGVCSSTGVPYSIVNVAGMTYSWSFNVSDASIASGQGTNAVTANYNSTYLFGSLSVTANNACGASAPRILAIKATPETPTSITGATSVCANQFGVPYSISPIATATSYTWTGPMGSHISDGVTTSAGKALTTTATSVTVNFGSTSGILYVKASNGCGEGSNKLLSISFVCKSTEETDNTASLEIFPNPAQEFIDLDYIASSTGSGAVTISDIMGREIYKQSSSWNEGENTSRINLRGMNKGIYLLTLEQSGQKITRKLIIE